MGKVSVQFGPNCAHCRGHLNGRPSPLPSESVGLSLRRNLVRLALAGLQQIPAFVREMHRLVGCLVARHVIGPRAAHLASVHKLDLAARNLSFHENKL